jgi:antitoxin component YwqK of YwqJK toxin-antitoxin module
MRLSIVLLIISLNLFSQKEIEPERIKAFNITVNYDTYTVKTQMLKDVKKVTVDNDLTYLWFNAHKILETKGGFDGKLIHGYYKSFYLNNQLRESGEVKYGLKHNVWKNWYPDGKLKEVITYKKGRKNGYYELYNELGEIMAKGSFKNDLLHGKFYTYDTRGNITATKKYKNGNEVIPKPKKEKVKKEADTQKSEEKPEIKKEKKVKKRPLLNRFKKLFRKKDKQPVDPNTVDKPKPKSGHA